MRASVCRSAVFAIAIAAAGAIGASAQAGAEHLLISEAGITGADWVEIYNPGPAAVDLSNYYLTDAAGYLRLPCCPPLVPFTDFVARFPAGSTIAAGGVVTVAMSADAFITQFGIAPNFEMPLNKPNVPTVPDMDPAWAASVGFGKSLDDIGEWVCLFFWDQASDRVKDVDIIRLGNSDQPPNKGNQCFDGPDAGTTCDPYLNDALTMPAMALGAAPATPAPAKSHKRRFLEARREVACNGNGIDGHDETSENTRITWDGTAPNAYTNATPGVAPVLPPAPGECFTDMNQSGGVDVDDLIGVILQWGPCPNAVPCTGVCPGDVAPTGCRDCSVDVDDLIAVILTWGPCP
jgi:hypothetical protein